MELHSILCVFKMVIIIFIFFFFNDTATTEIYTLSLHDALPIFARFCLLPRRRRFGISARRKFTMSAPSQSDRKSTRLNSSHLVISYAVFCLKKQKPKYSKMCRQ